MLVSRRTLHSGKKPRRCSRPHAHAETLRLLTTDDDRERSDVKLVVITETGYRMRLLLLVCVMLRALRMLQKLLYLRPQTTTLRLLPLALTLALTIVATPATARVRAVRPAAATMMTVLRTIGLLHLRATTTTIIATHSTTTTLTLTTLTLTTHAVLLRTGTTVVLLLMPLATPAAGTTMLPTQVVIPTASTVAGFQTVVVIMATATLATTLVTTHHARGKWGPTRDMAAVWVMAPIQGFDTNNNSGKYISCEARIPSGYSAETVLQRGPGGVLTSS